MWIDLICFTPSNYIPASYFIVTFTLMSRTFLLHTFYYVSSGLFSLRMLSLSETNITLLYYKLDVTKNGTDLWKSWGEYWLFRPTIESIRNGACAEYSDFLPFRKLVSKFSVARIFESCSVITSSLPTSSENHRYCSVVRKLFALLI